MPSRRKQTYAECVADRRCPSCHLLLVPEEQFKLCEKCRLLHKQRLIARMKNGCCRRCKKPATHRDLCEKHYEQSRRENKKRREFRRRNSLCQRCRAPAEKSHCEKCAEARAEVTKRRRRKLRKAGLCTNCAAPAIPDRSLCPECSERWAAKEAKRQADPERRAAQRARAAARKLAYAAAGLCNSCGKTPPKKNRKRCGRCAERSLEGARIAATKKRTQRLLAENQKNPAHSRLDPSALRKLMKV